ncbi:hypothetical protein [Mycoplasmopsis lipofaciens]|uniref:hypothetical protein n=1 Tax=Mycoplasmopsis lipofaciens TaxID=114884 RepID=UPI000481DA38|nr:hypothetical protein [Mycoplasmopsis lipofaciens]
MEKKVFKEKPPIFTEEKLKEILHYTDCNENPAWNSFLSKTVFELHSGAKGVSKSFGQAVITIFRLVNDIRFCSMWTRNQYNHIKKTLRPTFEKVLSFLKNEHNLDFTPYVSIYDSGVYWDYDDGGLGRAIYFENFEKIQAFQGITLKNNDFLFGELVLDEPIEDPADTLKLPHQLEELYKLQESKLPLLIANTVSRLKAPDDFQIKIKFLYNIFTTDHWIIKNYHNNIINLVLPNGTLNEVVKKELIENKFIQVINEEFKSSLGISCTMYSKFFVPKKELSDYQIKQLDSLEKENYKMWVITVLGFAFEDPNNKPNYFLRPYLYTPKNKKLNQIKVIRNLEEIPDKSIVAIYDGFDPGLSDKSAWVRTLLLESGHIIILNAIDNLGQKIKKKSSKPRTQINELLINLIKKSNEELFIKYKNKFFNSDFKTVILTDNDIIAESLNLLIIKENINAFCMLANRRDTNKQKFGIINRQNWQKWIFKNQMIFLTKNSAFIIDYLAKQMILPDETKRDETINKEIYDLVNAFEMSCSMLYQYQYSMQMKINKEKNERIK